MPFYMRFCPLHPVEPTQQALLPARHLGKTIPPYLCL